MDLLDTNGISEARRGTAAAIAWLTSVDPIDIHLSVITLGEIMRGIALKERSDPTLAAQLSTWLQTLRHHYADRVLPISASVMSDADAVEIAQLCDSNAASVMTSSSRCR